MGFEVRITHADTFLDIIEHPISRAEWDHVVSQDPTLSVSTEDYCQRRSADGGTELFHPVHWTKHPDSPPLWFVDGAIETRSPDEPTMIKMAEIAQRLDAKLLDEDD